MFFFKTKMAQHNQLGKKGEMIAKQYLENIGYRILHENWRFRHKEIDLICKENAILVFVEVKTRSADFFQKPYESVDTKKQEFLIEAAEAFIESYTEFSELRFDVISIVQRPNQSPIIEHIREAFIPTINN
jgi:putative endonuclease